MRTLWLARPLRVAIMALLALYPIHLGAQDEGSDDNKGPEVLTRGPIHEAFAEPGSLDPKKGMTAPKEPPANVEEVPPQEKPDEAAVWIPGYWSYDLERADYIWVSGVWRIPPRERSWVPGYWTNSADGWIWTPGFWMAAEARKLEYLPAPPVTLEVGPAVPTPGPDYIWSPGCWIWIGTRYAWQPGYWVVADPDWVWQPAHYVWSCRGYLYVNGYWDLAVPRRGILYAPVYFPAPAVNVVVGGPHISVGFGIFTPNIAISVEALSVDLFVAPGFCHFYFGDYYGPSCAVWGFRPWFWHDPHHVWFDPWYCHSRWRHGRDWCDRVRHDHDDREHHRERRPPHNYKEQQERLSKLPAKDRDREAIAKPGKDIAMANPDFKRPVDTITRDDANRGKEVNKFRDSRAKWEGEGKSPAGKGKDRSDIVGIDDKPGRPDTGKTRDTSKEPGRMPPRTPDGKGKDRVPDSDDDRLQPPTGKSPKTPDTKGKDRIPDSDDDRLQPPTGKSPRTPDKDDSGDRANTPSTRNPPKSGNDGKGSGPKTRTRDSVDDDNQPPSTKSPKTRDEGKSRDRDTSADDKDIPTRKSPRSGSDDSSKGRDRGDATGDSPTRKSPKSGSSDGKGKSPSYDPPKTKSPSTDSSSKTRSSSGDNSKGRSSSPSGYGSPSSLDAGRDSDKQDRGSSSKSRQNSVNYGNTGRDWMGRIGDSDSSSRSTDSWGGTTRRSTDQGTWTPDYGRGSSEKVSIPKSPVYGNPSGSPTQAGNPPSRPSIPTPSSGSSSSSSKSRGDSSSRSSSGSSSSGSSHGKNR